MRTSTKAWPALLFFFSLALLRTGPALFAGANAVAAFNTPDTWIHLWVFWRAPFAMLGGDIAYLTSDLLTYPFVVRAPTAVCDPLLPWLSIPFQAVGCPLPLAFNLLTLIGLAFTGFSVWLLAKHLSGRGDAAMLAGTIAAMNPFLFRQLAAGFTEFAWWGFIPLTLHLLLLWIEKPAWKRLAAHVATLLLMALMSIYATAYYVMLAALLLVVETCRRKPLASTSLKRMLIAHVAAAASLMPLIAIWIAVLSESGFKEAPFGIAFEVPSPVFMPTEQAFPEPIPPPANATSPDHPPPPPRPPPPPPKPMRAEQAPAWAHDRWRTLYASLDLGEFFSITNTSAPRPLKNIFNPSTLPYRSSLVSGREWLPVMLLACLAVFAPKLRPEKKFWLLAVFLFFLLAMGPFPIWNSKVYNNMTLPYAWLFHWAPGFSRLIFPARAILVSALGLSVLSAAGAAALLRKLEQRLKPTVCAAVAACACVCIVLAWPQLGDTHLSLPASKQDIPEFYRHIANEPGRFALLELPLDESAALRAYCQTLHRKPIFKGAVPDFMLQEYGDKSLLENPLVVLLNEHSLDRIEDAEKTPDHLRGAAGELTQLGFKYALFHAPRHLLVEQQNRLVAAMERALGPSILLAPNTHAWLLLNPNFDSKNTLHELNDKTGSRQQP